VNTLKEEISHVTDLLDASLAPGTVELILGSDFTGLASPAGAASSSPGPSTSASPSATGSPSASASPSATGALASTNGGITAAAACTSDSSAFAGPLSP
jgi:hypothetical protein